MRSNVTLSSGTASFLERRVKHGGTANNEYKRNFAFVTTLFFKVLTRITVLVSFTVEQRREWA